MVFQENKPDFLPVCVVFNPDSESGMRSWASRISEGSGIVENSPK